MKFKLSFGKKSSHPPAADRVMDLSHQGYSEPEIIRSLRKEGYSPREADVAMKEAVRSSAIPGRGMEQYPRPPVGRRPPSQEEEPSRDIFDDEPGPPTDEPGSPQEPEAYSQEPEPPYPQEFAMPEVPGQRRQVPRESREPRESRKSRQQFDEPQDLEEEFIPAVGRKPDSRGATEEVVEGLIEEKWGMFEREVDQLNERLDRFNERISSLEATITQFRGVKKDDVQQIREAIDSYKENISEVSQRIEAMEHAVKDSITPMMQSLRSLSDTLKTMKGQG